MLHPNAFLSALWRPETRDQVFVAMSFETRFAERFDTIIRPAIEDELFHGRRLKAFRVDNSRTGDSILTEIVDGIAHSRLILADVSCVDEGRYGGLPVRNGNVMYEVGIALACRQSSEVLLIRDDQKHFLFDVSTIPYRIIDFTNRSMAIAVLREALVDRIRETDAIRDARVMMAARSLEQEELLMLRSMAELRPDQAREFTSKSLGGQLSIPVQRGISGLLSKGCLRSVMADPSTGAIFYTMTPFGYALAKVVESLLEEYAPAPEKEPAE